MSSRPRILGVDDNPRNLNILRKALGEEYRYLSAASGEEALEVAPGFRPDVILLDLMMAGLGGYETCKRIRARADLASTKILMVSAKGTAADRLEGYAVGADDYIVKPFDPAELLAKVRVYLRLKSVEEVDRLKSNLLALLSHETRTPLTLILGPTSLLLDSEDLPARHRDLVAVVDSGARRLVSLLDRVSFLSQLNMGEIAFRIGPEDLAAIARGAVERAQRSSVEANVHVTLDAESPAPVEADASHLGRALDDLLDNAIRFSPSGGTVRVRIAATESGYRLAVSDTGPGVHPDLLPRLFQEFAVADVEHHTHGHGLGLATARLIAERHAGSLDLEPDATSGGATFRLDLPSSDPQARRALAP